MNAICSRGISEFAVAVAFGIVFFLWIFTGFDACALTRSVRFLENVYTVLSVVLVAVSLLFSNCEYALEFLWYSQVCAVPECMYKRDFFWPHFILHILLAQSLLDTDLPQILQVV